MKNIFLNLALFLLPAGAALAQCTTLTGTLSSNTTLNAAVCYHLEDCYVVPTGITLTIPAGTEILCAPGSNLVVERGGVLTAIGTANNPIVFTSDQAINSRAPGDWGGIAIFGSAANNVSPNATTKVCVNRSFGGNVANDNSGSLQYLRIEFAGSITDRDEAAGLLLASVGSGTTVDHIQVSESAADGVLSWGGTYNAKHLLVLNAYRNDFSYSLGNVSKQQFLLGLRRDINAHYGSGTFSNGVYIDNLVAMATPQTQPLLSNLTLIGPDYCGTSVSSDFRNGITFDDNGAATIRNSAIGKWPDNGLFLADAGSIGHTASNALNFSTNAIINATGGADYAHAGSWATGCGGSLSSMMAWITDVGLSTCDEPGNNFSLTDFGYNMNVCGTYCTTRPTLTYSGSGLNGVDFSSPFNTFFDATVSRKGAIQPTDWTLSWAEFCPQSAVYCSCDVPAEKAALQLVPNPASSEATAYFDAEVTGEAVLVVSDPITGAVLRETTIKVQEPGRQAIRFSAAGLREAVYPVQVRMPAQEWKGQLVVR